MASELNPTLECPLCGVVEFRKCFTKKDRHFYQCSQCDMQMQSPLPTLTELADYYEQSFANGMYQEFAAADEMKRMTARQRISEIQRTVPIEGKWLDVGCANGVFVQAVAGHGVDAAGVELSQHAVSIGREQGLSLHVGTVDDLPAGETYDCITAFDVLEHVLEPLDFIGSLRSRLNDGGHVIMTVPNTGGIVRRLMGKRWYFYIPEEHLHYFNRKNLAGLMRKQGFDVLEVGATHKPMTYDYAMTQFAEFNPLIFRVLKAVSNVVPKKLRSRPVPLPIGELRIIARKGVSVKDDHFDSVEQNQHVPQPA